MRQTLQNNKNKGFLLLEIIIAIGLISIVIISLVGLGVLGIKNSASTIKSNYANFLITEEFEAIRTFRDGTSWTTNGLGNITTGANNPHYLLNNSGSWTIVNGQESIIYRGTTFFRSLTIDRVSRDANFNIQDSYNQALDDNDTRKITITISWDEKNLQNISYLTNWRQ